MKKGLGNYSDNSEKCINGFQRIVFTFDFTWKDIHTIIGQTLPKAEREMILEGATPYADDLYMTDPYLIGATVVPRTDPN